MKSLDVILSRLTAEELKTCIEYICRFENLRKLTLDLIFCETTEAIDDCLSLIGQKCNKLLRFQFINYCFTTRSDQFFNSIVEFKAILSINFRNNTVLSGSVECFKHCKQLKQLDIDCSELTEHFFANSDTFIPKLRSLRIKNEKEFSDSFIESFLLMKNQKIKILLRYSITECLNYKTW